MSKKDNEIKPIFVIGCPRSGTTVLTWCLGQHPNILPLEEIVWLDNLTTDLELLYMQGIRRGLHSYLGSIAMPKKGFHRYFAEMVDNMVKRNMQRWVEGSKLVLEEFGIDVQKGNYRVVRSESDPKNRWIDGTPANTHYVYGLLRLFPSAKFIHILREPKKVAVSLMNFSSMGGRDLSEEEAFNVWLWYVKAALLAEEALGSGRVKRILFEELIRRPGDTLAKALAFMGEVYHPDCLLPLNEQINSSKTAEAQKQKLTFRTKGSGSYEKEADMFYHELIERKQARSARLSSLKSLRSSFLESCYVRRPEAFSDVYKDEQIIKLQQALKSLPLTLLDYGPKEIYAGEDFNLQPSGDNAIWAVTDNATPLARLVLNNIPLKSSVQEGGKLVTATVPKELFSKPGEYSLYLLNESLKRKSNELMLVVKEPKPMVLLDYGPKKIHAGEDFNVQSGGASAIWTVTENATPSTVLVLNNRLLESNVSGNGKTVTAAVPKESYSKAGKFPLFLQDTKSGQKSNELLFRVNGK